MGQIQVTVPDLGGMDEVEVIEICVQPGDGITAEEALVVLESDKATMEVPAPMDGTVHSLLVSIGDKVNSGSPIAMMETQGAEPEVMSEEPEPVQEVVVEAVAEAPVESAAAPASEQVIEVRVPDLGGLEQVEVIELVANVGDALDAEESLLILESDKASMDIPVEKAGTLVSMNVAVGDKVNEGDLVATMKVMTQAAPAAASKPAQQAVAQAPAPAKPVAPAKPAVQEVQSSSSDNASSSIHAGPAVRKVAREFGVELAQVKGSGPRSRILKEDVQAFVKQRVNAPAAAPAAAVVKGSDEDFSRHGEISEASLSKIKQVTAKNMVQSWTTIPQVTQFDEADITDLEAYRKGEMSSQLEDGVKISPLAFILKACAVALQKFPQFNSSLGPNGDTLILKQYYNIAVAVDTPDGLMVPVIKQAQSKGLIDFAKESSKLAKQAREKKLPMDAMMGASFTISSLGGIGGTAFTPIVNAPQVAILGVSKAAMKPVWNGSSFEPRLMLPLSVSYDHRVIDGAQAAQFTRYLCQLLSDIRHLLL